jgi:hypothetical protein
MRFFRIIPGASIAFALLAATSDVRKGIDVDSNGRVDFLVTTTGMRGAVGFGMTETVLVPTTLNQIACHDGVVVMADSSKEVYEPDFAWTDLRCRLPPLWSGFDTRESTLGDDGYAYLFVRIYHRRTWSDGWIRVELVEQSRYTFPEFGMGRPPTGA